MAATNFRQFSLGLRRETQRLTNEQVVLFQRRIGLEALRRIVQKTPVDTGRARGNWDLTIGLPSGSADMDRKDPGGGDTIRRGSAALSNLKAFALIYITNNLPYINYLENGSSKQAPVGMVEVTVQELQQLRVAG